MTTASSDKYEPFLSLLDFRDVNPLEAERTAEKCFHAQAWLVKDLAAAEYAEILIADSYDIKKSDLLLTVPDEYTNDASRKAWVHVQEGRREAYEKLAKAKVKVEYYKRLLKLFDQASYYYGQKAKR